MTGVSLFADVDGFTAYVADAEANGELPEAVRAYHVQRSELRDVLVDDFDGLRIQYQGDRIQGLVYRPIGREDEVAVKAVRTAAAMMSTTTQVLPQVIGEAAKPLQIGLAYGPVVVTKVGERGNRDVVSLGQSTADAARIQQALPGGSIGSTTRCAKTCPTGCKTSSNGIPQRERTSRSTSPRTLWNASRRRSHRRSASRSSAPPLSPPSVSALLSCSATSRIPPSNPNPSAPRCDLGCLDEALMAASLR